MAIRAYDESYNHNAQSILGHAVDFAVMSLNIDPDVFGGAFAVSDASRQFANGNPRYVAGMNGCELARMVLTETHTTFADTEDSMFLDKSPEYWAGWALAYYQWFSSRSFMDILTAVPLPRIIEMYPVYHEMDIQQFVDRMDELLKQYYPYTRLRTRRQNCGLSQGSEGQAARESQRKAPLRQYESRRTSAVVSL